MPRANRHYIPGYIWHLTHRCHKKEFLLKFARDRQSYVHWLYEARKRFGITILNYTVTSNHIHLLVKDTGGKNHIPATMQLVASHTGQQYNRRKHRKGAYWEDRYHATMIESGVHLRRCLMYIDLNMVRAGAVDHPKDWVWGGYQEIQGKRCRNRVIDLKALKDVFEMDSVENLRKSHAEWIGAALGGAEMGRDEIWTESVAVGSEDFVRRTRQRIGIRVKGRKVVEKGGAFTLREPMSDYGLYSGPENSPIVPENRYLWDVL